MQYSISVTEAEIWLRLGLGFVAPKCLKWLWSGNESYCNLQALNRVSSFGA